MLCDINSVFINAKITIISKVYYNKDPTGHPLAFTDETRVKKLAFLETFVKTSTFFPFVFISCFVNKLVVNIFLRCPVANFSHTAILYVA